jgi:acyl-coenzyme A synthetase/AMP-(fatty) acid ligase
VDASLVFAAPAALRSIVRTATALDDAQRARCARVRLLLSAGAPVPRETLRAASDLLGGCEAHTPYGMTEALPVTDVTLTELDVAQTRDGILVGHPVRGVQVSVSPLSADGTAAGALTDEAGVTGEVCVRGPHVKDHYDQLWATERSGSRDPGWHRTGDVGHVDAEGRLWVEGRLVHVVTTPDGPVTPVGVERRVEQVADVRLAAVAGVGPRGAQQLVVVVEAPGHAVGVADLALTDQVRAAAGVPVSAVLVVSALPVDVRHNSKIDRTAVARTADRALAGAPAR